MNSRFLRITVTAALLALVACNYDVPLTTRPTRPVDSRLVGKWSLAPDKDEHLISYAIFYDGDLYRAYHSDVAGLPLISVQNLNDSERKYLYVAWSLPEDGKRLTLRSVSTDVIPPATKSRAAIVKLIAQNRENPKLLGEAGEYTRDP
jgi:hypothetical protein